VCHFVLFQKFQVLMNLSANSFCSITLVSVKPLLMSLKVLLITINTDEKGANERRLSFI